jgi:MerR family transcriptional regulator/heat shock protein HspR
MGKRESRKAAFMISAVAEQYQLHPQTLRLYEREGLLKPSRSDGNTGFIRPRIWNAWM